MSDLKFRSHSLLQSDSGDHFLTVMAYNSRGDVIQTDGCLAEIFSICYSHCNIVVLDMTKSLHHLLELPQIHPHNHAQVLVLNHFRRALKMYATFNQKKTDMNKNVFYNRRKIHKEKIYNVSF